MSWDHRPAYAHLIGDASEGQQQEGGANSQNNCVPTTETLICQAYGGPDLDPQAITDRTYGTSFHGGEDYLATLSVLRQFWPACPRVSFANVAGSFGLLDAEGQQGHAIGCSFWCDPAGVIQTYISGIRHVCTLLAHVGGQVHILNSEYANLVVLDDQSFLAATQGTAGELMLFQQPLPLEDDMAWNLDQKRLAVIEVRRHFEPWPASLPSVDVYAERIHDDGSNYLEVRDQLAAELAAHSWVDLFDRVAALERAISALKTLPGLPAELEAEVEAIEAQMAAIAAAASR